MTWTTPRTWVRGELATESILNTHVRDNLDYLYGNQGALAGFFSRVSLGTHEDCDVRNYKVQLIGADVIVFDNGVAVADWPVLTADVTASGPGGIDTGTEQASTWYEIYAIHKSSDGTKNLLLHQAKDYFLDETYDSDDTTTPIRAATSTVTARSQGFKVDTAGRVDFIDVEIIRVGAVSGYMWAELQSDAAGVPSGTVLATSVKLIAGDVYTSSQWVRFIFRTPVSLTAATQYHLVLTGDWTASDAVYVAWREDASAATYANGAKSTKAGGTWATTATSDFSFKVYVTRNDTAVTMPSGYDGKALIGFVRNNSSSDFVLFSAADRRVIFLQTKNLIVGGTATTPTLLDTSTLVPPGRIKLRMFGDTGGAGSLWLLPVPTGFKPATGVRDAGASGTSAGQSLQSLEIITETQGIYTQDTSGTYDLIGDSWEW